MAIRHKNHKPYSSGRGNRKASECSKGENAIDAGSSEIEIEIEIESGGRNLITVTDDGNGIEKNDLELAFMRHATSKLSDSELIEIKHLGFRGEFNCSSK
ncbi:DNA mismatch repair protein mutL [Wolbachia endosymbiont of Cylisticus convexus]|nr:DNA mismatch repair protein mutL [Wolbachia endosymbiont of Cylisticus convexus]RDD33935.1 DNA mismatch repair protein mutL [Wolbachia endosymbiont of Cylisticus convexus]